MRRDSPLLAVLLVVVTFGIIWLGLNWMASQQVDSGNWVAPAALGSGDAVNGADVAVDPFAPDAVATGSGAVELDVVKDVLKAAIAAYLMLFLSYAALLAIVWIGLCWRSKPAQHLVAAETALRPGWLLLFILLLLGAAGFAVYASADPPVANMASDARWILAALSTLLAALAFWLNTASATPNSLRRSVPGYTLLPMHGSRGK